MQPTMSRNQQDEVLERPAAVAQPDRLVGIKEVQSLIGMGPSSIYSWTKEGKFVEPVRLSARCTRWKLSQVQAGSQPAMVAGLFLSSTQLCKPLDVTRQASVAFRDVPTLFLSRSPPWKYLESAPGSFEFNSDRRSS
jgi:prophage regulatory protein